MAIDIRCSAQNGNCKVLLARIHDDSLEIVQRHHGQHHVTRIPLRDLFQDAVDISSLGDLVSL